MSTAESLKVTSHVGRDILAAAAGFKTEAAVVWEYVVNSLQYMDEGVLPKVQVLVKPRARTIEIRDNGCGMSADDLQNQFFRMHGKNLDRVRGRPGRGKFGTGKSAAFGIGRLLRVDTRRNGIRNVVQLSREVIDASTGEDIPLDWVVRDESTGFPNGTTVTIDDVFLPKLNTYPLIEYIERHLMIYRARLPEVAVNEHVCQYHEPDVSKIYRFHPTNAQAETIGDVELLIKVATLPLPSAEQGISITAGLGNLVAIETAGIEAKELGNYLFGNIDVPLLESTESPMEPYDVTRSLRLNPQHLVVRILLPFIGSKLEEVRKEQVQRLRAAQKTEEARRLTSEARRIADILNQDFRSMIGRLRDIRSASAQPGDLASHFGNGNTADTLEGVWVEGIGTPGNIDELIPGEQSRPQSNQNSRLDPSIAHTGQPDEAGKSAVDSAGGAGNKRHRPRGGFNVDFRNLGSNADRSKYDRTSLAILINLDHPVVKKAMLNGSVEDINFRRLAYEIAFTEYAIALGVEMVEQDPDMPADDILYEVRSTLNRVSAGAAALYV